MTCDGCGATARPDAQWCGQCYRSFLDARRPEHLGHGPQRTVPQQLTARPAVHSRWRKSSTTYGPLGRMLWTLLVVLVAGLCWFSADPFAIAGWCLIAAPLILRSVWSKSRVR
jgi:hypothetical protein